MAELQELPPGWECKFDHRTSKFYYINHYTKITTWDDPRLLKKNGETPKHHQNVPAECIPLQHGSPDLKRNYVYPTHPSPIPAFQMPGRYSPKSIPLQDMKMTKTTGLSVRGSKIQDSSMTVPDIDESVTKIRSMFPTASDTHIKLLLKKYHGREAVVISALQVEKHPIAEPGPFATPPPSRNIYPGPHVHFQMTPPLGFRSASKNSPVLRPGSGMSSAYTGSPHIGRAQSHSSPKLKLSHRYMKSIFPDAEETIILDILSNNENNIQKASDALKEMGYKKKDTVKAAKQQAEAKAEQNKMEEEKKAKPPSPPPKLITVAEKALIRAKLQEKYKDIEETVITMALDSVDFDMERANKILELMKQEEKQKSEDATDASKNKEEVSKMDSLKSESLPISQSRQSIKSLLKSEKTEKNMFDRIIEEVGNRTCALGSNYRWNNTKQSLAKGPNEKLLLEDYVKWQGPNPNLRQKPTTPLAKGPNPFLLLGRTYAPRGPNPELRKGPKFGLAKGSIYQQYKGQLVEESRGK